MKIIEQLHFEDLSTDISFNSCERIEKLFAFWHNHWEQTYKELGVWSEIEKVNGDDFFNKRIFSFWYADEPVGCVHLSLLNLKNPSHLSLSFLRNYPAKMITFLIKNGFTKVFCLNNLHIRQDWRKTETNYPLAQVLTSIGFFKAQVIGGDALICYSRNNRKTNQLILKHNGIKYCTELRFNHEADFLYVPLSTSTTFPDLECQRLTLLFLNKKEKQFSLKDTTEAVPTYSPSIF